MDTLSIVLFIRAAGLLCLKLRRRKKITAYKNELLLLQVCTHILIIKSLEPQIIITKLYKLLPSS